MFLFKHTIFNGGLLYSFLKYFHMSKILSKYYHNVYRTNLTLNKSELIKRIKKIAWVCFLSKLRKKIQLLQIVNVLF
jgi:hypothetical protein